MPSFIISGRKFELDREGIESRLGDRLPDPVREHYVVVNGLRFPPKQVLADATGLDRADFTTHQARRILRRLGFVAARVAADRDDRLEAAEGGPLAGRQADALRPFIGKWVALATPTEVLVAADSPEEVLGWLARHERQAPYGMFRVPASTAEAEGVAPA